MFFTLSHSYYAKQYRGRNKNTIKYNQLIQILTFGKAKYNRWYRQEHTWYDLKNCNYTKKEWDKYSYRQLRAIRLHQLASTPLSKRKYNLIKQMQHASRHSRKQGASLIKYLKSKMILDRASRLLENRSDPLPKYYFYKPLIAFRNSHLKLLKVGGAKLVDSYNKPILDRVHRGIQKTAKYINSHRNNQQLLIMNTEFKPSIAALIGQSDDINTHVQGLAMTTNRYTMNEQRHIQALIGKEFSHITGYKRVKPSYKHGHLTFSDGDFIVLCPAFKLRRNRNDNDNLVLSYTNLIGRQEKYPPLIKHDAPLKYKLTQLRKYDFYTGKQYRIPVLSKTRAKSQNDYIQFKYWGFNKLFISACNNSAHSNLKWSLQFNRRAKTNIRKINKIYKQCHINEAKAKTKHDAWITLSIKTILEQSLAHQSWAKINKAWANSLYCPSACYLPGLQLNYEKIIQTHQSIINQLKSQLIDQFIHKLELLIILVDLLTCQHTYNAPTVIIPTAMHSISIISTLEQLQLFRHKPIRIGISADYRIKLH